MKSIFVVTLLIVVLFSALSCAQNKQQERIVYFGDNVTADQRKATIDQLTARSGIQLISGNPGQQQFILVGVNSIDPCKEGIILCKALLNPRVNVIGPCEACSRCCMPGGFVVRGDPAQKSPTLYSILAEIEKGKASKPTSIVLSIKVPEQNVQSVRELMQLERLALSKQNIDFNLILNNTRQFGKELMRTK